MQVAFTDLGKLPLDNDVEPFCLFNFLSARECIRTVDRQGEACERRALTKVIDFLDPTLTERGRFPCNLLQPRSRGSYLGYIERVFILGGCKL